MKDNKKIKNEKKEKKKKKGGKFNVHALLIIAEMSKKHKIKNRKILGNVFVISDMCIYISIGYLIVGLLPFSVITCIT